MGRYEAIMRVALALTGISYIVLVGVRHAWRDWRIILRQNTLRRLGPRGETRGLPTGEWPRPDAPWPGPGRRRVRDRLAERRARRDQEWERPPRDDYMPGEFQPPEGHR